MRRRGQDEEQEGVGARLGRFIALLACLFAVGAGFVICSMLSRDTLALLLGGVMVGAFTLPIIVFLLVVLYRRDTARREPAQPTYQPPPIIINVPDGRGLPQQQQPALPFYDVNAGAPVRRQREWDVIGGNGGQ